MTGKSTFAGNGFLSAIKGTPFSIGARWIALLTALPGSADAALTEPAGNNYSRIEVTFGAVAARAMSNSADLLWGVASGAWGTIVGWALCDAQADGNWLYADSLSVQKAIEQNDQMKIAAGQLTINEV